MSSIVEDSVVQKTIEAEIATIGLCLIWLILAFYYAWKDKRFIPIPAAVTSHITFFDTLWGFFSYIVPQVLIVPAIIAYFYGGNFSTSSQEARSFYTFLAMLTAFLALLFYYFVILSRDKKNTVLGYSTKPWYQNFWIGVTSWLYIFPVIFLWSHILESGLLYIFKELPKVQSAVQQFQLVKNNPKLVVPYIFLIVVAAPVCEELLFRGFLLNWLKRKFNSSKWAITISALIFAAFHYTTEQSITNIEILSSLFILGCFLGYLYESNRSLWTSIGLHATFNLITLIIILLS